jgi:ferric-dicitrate binding protein FerR (iron transport regulator)
MTTEQRLKQAFERPTAGIPEDGAYDRFLRHRRRRGRRAAVGAGVALCLVAGLALAAPRLLPARGGVAGGGQDRKGPALVRVGTVPWQGARLEGTGGGCW